MNYEMEISIEVKSMELIDARKTDAFNRLV